MAVTVSRPGQANKSGAVDALFLKMFSGEVMTEFDNTTIMQGLHRVIPITSGKQYQFPIIGGTEAYYHQAGDDVTARAIAHGERTVNVDDLLVTSAYIYNPDELKNHYEFRGTYTQKMGQALAERFDVNVMCELVSAAKTASGTPLTESPGGNIYYGGDAASGFDSTTLATRVETFLAGLREMGQAFDEKNVKGVRKVIIKPSMYWDLVDYSKTLANSGLINVDIGGSGSISKGVIGDIMGWQVIKHNLMPTTDLTTTNNADEGTYKDKFHGTDCSLVKAICFTDEAVVTLKMLELNMDSDWCIEKRAHLFVAEYLMGHGVLRPEAAGVMINSVAP